MIEILVQTAGPRGWACRYNDELACAWGAVRALWGLAALPQALRTPQVEAAITSGVDFVFGDADRLAAGDFPTSGKIHKHWSQLSFPLFYQVDVLFSLRVAAELGVLDRPGAQVALDWLAERRLPQGDWIGASPYRSVTWHVFGSNKETRRWASLHAARIMKLAGR